MTLTTFSRINDLKSWLLAQKRSGKIIGFVPTMGALHDGHISLIRKALEECDTVVASIFVNPTQFNNPSDLKLYPRTLEADLELLEKAGTHAVFVPEVSEIYPRLEKHRWDLGVLTSTLEGFYRPGHFDGVLTVVKRLFEIVNPDKAFFGEKDFQQVAVIRELVKKENMPVTVIACPSVREPNGLAMSSRNRRLNNEQREAAGNISRILRWMKNKKNEMDPAELKKAGIKAFENVHKLRLEYLEIADPTTLRPINKWENGKEAIALAAVFVDDIRLIDNMHL